MANNKAFDMIEDALNEAIKTSADHDDGDFLVEWVAIAYVTNPDKEKGSGYPMFFSNGDLATHRARGLYTTALMYLGQAEMDDD